MIKNKNILIVGAGGFIGGHLVKKLLKDGNKIVASDIKPKEYWFQDFDNVNNHYSLDMKEIENNPAPAPTFNYQSGTPPELAMQAAPAPPEPEPPMQVETFILGNAPISCNLNTRICTRVPEP